MGTPHAIDGGIITPSFTFKDAIVVLVIEVLALVEGATTVPPILESGVRSSLVFVFLVFSIPKYLLVGKGTSLFYILPLLNLIHTRR